ncbi:MAG: hypothetical protein ACE10G_03230 [Gemmatimonadales bacterium]
MKHDRRFSCLLLSVSIIGITAIEAGAHQRWNLVRQASYRVPGSVKYVRDVARDRSGQLVALVQEHDTHGFGYVQFFDSDGTPSRQMGKGSIFFGTHLTVGRPGAVVVSEATGRPGSGQGPGFRLFERWEEKARLSLTDLGLTDPGNKRAAQVSGLAMDKSGRIIAAITRHPEHGTGWEVLIAVVDARKRAVETQFVALSLPNLKGLNRNIGLTARGYEEVGMVRFARGDDGVLYVAYTNEPVIYRYRADGHLLGKLEVTRSQRQPLSEAILTDERKTAERFLRAGTTYPLDTLKAYFSAMVPLPGGRLLVAGPDPLGTGSEVSIFGPTVNGLPSTSMVHLSVFLTPAFSVGKDDVAVDVEASEDGFQLVSYRVDK